MNTGYWRHDSFRDVAAFFTAVTEHDDHYEVNVYWLIQGMRKVWLASANGVDALEQVIKIDKSDVDKWYQWTPKPKLKDRRSS